MITADEIVPELQKADIVAPFVDAVVPAKGGALPTSCHPLYPFDGEALLRYTEQVGDVDSFSLFLNAWLQDGSGL